MDDVPFTPEHFTRLDNSDDGEFYAPARLVTHLDDPGIAALSDFYRRFVPAGGDVLDLMTSWISHLPDDVAYGSVAGLGMNRDELDANERLGERVIHNLNTAPRLPFDDAAFDACLIALSVQYLTQPLDVFGEIARVLKPGGGCAISFSNRCFPTKAVEIWRALNDSGHIWLVQEYFRRAGGFDEAVVEDLSSGGMMADPLYVVTARRMR
ncbi:MAG: SAM-dependent methyltransferase [Alphaproteobacteria bacterium]|jgi:SAM-dependent methyltransferase